MLFQKFDFSNSEATGKFQIDTSLHNASWLNYYQQYNYVLYSIIEKGLPKYYAFNCRARSILFLIRHSLELCLKYNLFKRDAAIPAIHDFGSLYEAFGDTGTVPNGFKEVAAMLDFDRDGSAFRYYYNNAGKQPYFTFKDKIEVAKIFEEYNKLKTSEAFHVGLISPVFRYQDRRTRWDLTFHMGECRQLAHIRAQYDQAIEFIIEGVLLEHWEIDKVYLPLLFLIRHSLEIALKYNIAEVQKYSTLIKDKNVDREHSLLTLYNLYRDFLGKLDLSKTDEFIRKQLQAYDEEYRQFNNQLHDLDINSRYFRFPVDKDGNIHKINLSKNEIIEILKIYYHLDPFITFTNDVLEEQGLLFRYDME